MRREEDSVAGRDSFSTQIFVPIRSAFLIFFTTFFMSDSNKHFPCDESLIDFVFVKRTFEKFFQEQGKQAEEFAKRWQVFHHRDFNGVDPLAEQKIWDSPVPGEVWDEIIQSVSDC